MSKVIDNRERDPTGGKTLTSSQAGTTRVYSSRRIRLSRASNFTRKTSMASTVEREGEGVSF